ncbi:MAG: A/G-specific adenine glycosylase [Actinomycetota bacterium]
MDVRPALREWYRPRRLAYPWRQLRPDPYRVLVSEVMLQQTQASRVSPAYRAFLRRFPTVVALASASRREVLEAWDGLGYNRRAVALSEAARAIVADHGGRLPADPEALIKLRGVGPYTAAAVASIGHGVPVAAVDTNVARVLARAALGRERHHVPAAQLRRAADEWLDLSDPGAWNQALMDLGREVCRPKPRCEACPIFDACRFRRSSSVARRPQSRRQPRFRGSSRQLRGAVIRILRTTPSATIGALALAAGEPPERVSGAVRALAAEGLVTAGPAALAGRPAGRVRLGD